MKINGVTQNATISGSVGAFSVSYNTATIPYSATPYTVTYGYAGDANFIAAANNTSTTLTVNQATPSITGVASKVITYGIASVTLTGTVSGPGPVYPLSGETVTVKINGVTQNATISGSVGAFSVIYNTATIPYSATPYTVTYGYAGDANLGAAANNSSTTLTVNQAAPTDQWRYRQPEHRLWHSQRDSDRNRKRPGTCLPAKW